MLWMLWNWVVLQIDNHRGSDNKDIDYTDTCKDYSNNINDIANIDITYSFIGIIISTKKPLVLELKLFPKILKHAYSGDNEKLPMIISFNLKGEQERKLL